MIADSLADLDSLVRNDPLFQKDLTLNYLGNKNNIASNICFWAEFEVLVFTFKSLYGLGPGYFRDRHLPHNPTHLLGSSEGALLSLPSPPVWLLGNGMPYPWVKELLLAGDLSMRS